MWKEFFIWLDSLDMQFSPEYILFGNDHDFATGEMLLLIKSTIYTYLQKEKIISFEGTKYNFFKYIQTLFLSASENNIHDKFLQKWRKYIDVVLDVFN